MARHSWTQEELAFVKDNYTVMTDKDIAEHLGTHTESSVACKRKQNHWNRCKQKFFFSDAVIEFQKRGYILLSDEKDYKDTATNSLQYLCPKHIDMGPQCISLGHLQGGRGCYYCGREKTESARRIDLTDAIDSKELCLRKGFIYINTIRQNSILYINYICPKHPEAGIQKMRKNNMKREIITGCQYCFDTKKFKFSKGEEKVKNYLREHNIVFIPQYTFTDCRDINMLPF